MRSCLDDLIWRLQSASNKEALFDVVRDEAHRLGFDYCAYGLRLPLNLTAPKIVLLNNYPPSWQKRYEAEGYLAIDPTVRHGERSLMPLIWTDRVFSETRDFWEDAQAHGPRYGWSQSSTNLQNIRGMLTLARRAEALSKSELRKNGFRMTWLTLVAHQCMSDLIAVKMIPETRIHLSQREKVVLQWTAEGKTAGDVAVLMSITERTVNFHIANSMQKLCCSNKTSATIKAALLGFLS